MSIILALLLLVTFAIWPKILSGQEHTFVISDGMFMLDGKPFIIHGGEMHYARIPREYWKQRLRMARAMGLNTISTYVFWNYHEPSPGVWDFSTGNHDLRGFLREAQEESLWVILRPGPYACAEWEFGGYPWWLQKNKALVIRTNNESFLDSCHAYITRLVYEIRDFQITRGGPIIMVQVENEFGSYVAQRKDIPLVEHQTYNARIRDMLVEAGVDVPLFTSDGSWLFDKGAVPGVLPTANGEDDVEKLRRIVREYNNGSGPFMVAEFYPGWLAHWAEPFPRVAAADVTKQLGIYLQNDISFSFYMVHGGTNFGFTSGANYDKDHDIQPDLTSYDYDAPISEAGWATPKFLAIREMLAAHNKRNLPPIPDNLPVIAIPPIRLDRSFDLQEVIAGLSAVSHDEPLTFEDLNQGYGYVMYRRKCDTGVRGDLVIRGLRDYATVYVDGRRTGELNRYDKRYNMPVNVPAGATLEILVENMGRINYGAEIVNNLKGIIGNVEVDGEPLSGDWKMFSLPCDVQPDFSRYRSGSEPGRPAFFTGVFELRDTGDTFLDMRTWGKGIVFVNGYHLGRFWNIGPQQTLYLPGVWLRKGKNTITVFDQLNDRLHDEIRGVKTPILDELAPK